jgi:PAS domain S-box-containing protein/putative nucleotidyltransferase with HDIG domain
LNSKKIIEQTDGLDQFMADLAKAEKEREQFEVKYKSLFELAPDGILTADLKGFITSSNEAFSRLTGYSKEEIIGKHFSRLPTIRFTDISNYIKIFSSILNGKNLKQFVFEWVDKDGNNRFGETHAAVTRFNGRVTGIMAILRDVTEREKATMTLRNSEKNLKAYLECAPDAISISDLKGTIVYCNKRAEELSGYDKEELVGKNILSLNFFTSESLEKAAKLLALNAEGKPTGPNEFELITKEGNRVWVEINTTTIKEQDKMVVISFVRDISDRKRIEAELRIKDHAMDSAISGMLLIDLEGVVLYTNQAYLNMWAYPNAEKAIGQKLTDIAADKDLAQTLLHTVRTKGECKCELRAPLRDGRTKDLILSASLVKDENGIPIAIIASTVDITERRQAEEAMRASEERYRLLVENANEAIMVAQEGILKFANAKTAELSGYSSEDLSSMPFIKLIYPDDRDMVVERHFRRLKGELPPGVYPFRFVRKNGSVGWVEINAVLITWEGKPATLNFISDITERKQAEEKLKQSYERLQKTVDGTIDTIALIAETRDPYTAGHQRRVAKLASAIAAEMGFSKEQIETIRVAGILHDIGKVNVPTEILSKTGTLSEIEFSLVKSHSQVGREILKSLELPWTICPIVLQHHERMDGSGYPEGMSGQDISLGARVLAVADVIEAMSSHRPYRRSLGIGKALEEISKNRDILYDADVVDAAMRLMNEKEFKFE